MRKIVNVFVTMFLILSTVISNCPIKANSIENSNIAYQKNVTVSSTYPGKPWTPDKITDGIVDDQTTKNSRWSSKRIGESSTNPEQYDNRQQQWVMIDLKDRQEISQINIFWEGAYATSYKLQVSDDGTSFRDLVQINNNGAGWKKHNNFTSTTARYVRVLCLTPKNANWGYSIFEIEVYSNKEMSSSKDVVASIENKSPTISMDKTKIELPKVPEEFNVELFGSDNQQVIDMSGKIIEPLIDMNVHVMYKVTKKNDAKDVAVSTKDAIIRIPGKYQKNNTDNPKPNVVPGLREWKGLTGSYQFTESSRIVIANENRRKEAIMIQSYFKDLLHKNVEIVMESPKKGDIYLQDIVLDKVGKEGYYLLIDDFITIQSSTYTGFIYGGTSITQMLYQNLDSLKISKGMARDYPKYEVRAGMIDVGRMYIPLEYLEELSIYMAWFKLNEIHVHINDYWGQSGYSAFRLESECYPMINAKDGYYKKTDYRQYQKDMKNFGIDVITEIDTPYHAEAFRNVPNVRMLSGKKGYLDITTDEAFEANKKIIENLFDEYLDGDDPIIQSHKFHIGTDEYDKKYGNQMRKWTDHFATYVNNKGYESRAWASLGKNGFNGNAPVTSDITMNLWAPYWADVHEMYNAGYDIINTYGGWLYIVPAGNAGYPDRINTKRLYESFEVNNFKSGRNPNGEAIMPFAHPQTKGAEFAIWNDMTSFKTGFSWFDIFDRMKDAVSVVSEKTWYGEDDPNQNYGEFRERIDVLQDKAPNTNPGRYIESKEDVIADYDFTNVEDYLIDKTKNKYDAKVVNGISKDNELSFDGTGYLSLPMKSIGYPYSIHMNIYLNKLAEQNVIFNGKDGKLFINQEGNIYYQRGEYTFTFDEKINLKQNYNIIFTATNKGLNLYLNGRKIGNGKLTEPTIAGKVQQSSTFILPVEEVFKGIDGSISSLKIYNRVLSDNEVKEITEYKERENLALKKKTEVSGLEVNDGRFTSDKAVDGIVSSDSRVSFAKDKDEQWMLIDLGTIYPISEIHINFESVVGKYDIQVSKNGRDFKTVYSKNEALVTTPTSKIENMKFAEVNARYVRYVQKERWKHSINSKFYSGSIYELEVYRSLENELNEAIKMIESEIGKYKVGMTNGKLDQRYYESLNDRIQQWKEIAVNKNLTQNQMEENKTEIYKEIKNVEKHVIFNKQEAIDVYNKQLKIERKDYTKDSYELHQNRLIEIKEKIDHVKDYKDVNECLEDLKNAKNVLIKVNSNQLRDTIQQAEQINLLLYKDISNFEYALQEAKKEYEEPIDQESIDKCIKNLEQAIKALEYKTADYSKLEEVIKKANSLHKEDYVDFSEVEKALANVKEGLNITEQDKVDAMVNAIEIAIQELKKKDVVTKDESSSDVVPETGVFINTLFLWTMLLGVGVAIVLLAKKRTT